MRWRWLLVLPVALVLAVLSSASRLQVFWWPDELHEETTGEQGEPLDVVDDWLDADGDDRQRELTLTVIEVDPATTVATWSGPERVRPAPGTAVWEVRLAVEADPEVPLGACRVSIIDTLGREAMAAGGTVGEVSLPMTSCEPEGAAGPLYDGTRLEGVDPRPPSYDVSVYAVTDDDAVPDRVRVWWEAPDYVEVDVEVESGAAGS